MTQYARPNGDQENNWASGGFEDINEVSASDSDFAYTQDNPIPNTGNNGFFRAHLSSISTPDTGTVSVNWRSVLIDGGVVASSAGTGCNLVVSLIEGANTVIATVFNGAIDGETAWTAHDVDLTTPQRDSVGNWGDLDLVFDADGGGGSPDNRRGAGVSWAQLQAPDAPVAGAGPPAGSMMLMGVGK
jgi:hypothetical protein